MKLVLSNNQSEKFISFHKDIQQSEKIYEYSGYNSLLFILKPGEVDFVTIFNGYRSSDYEAVYLTSYLNRPEPAAALATILDSKDIRYVDGQIGRALSRSKLTEYTRLAAAGVSIPCTLGGSAKALLASSEVIMENLTFPVILKRADADRGIDNYSVASLERLVEIISAQKLSTIWIVQEFIPNDGFYRLSFYKDILSSVIFRAQHTREDGDMEKQHLNKPAGGVNASIIEPSELTDDIIEEARKGCVVMNRQFAGVDVLVDSRTHKPYILEVNYNPQLVTVSAYKDLRVEAFLEAMRTL